MPVPATVPRAKKSADKTTSAPEGFGLDPAQPGGLTTMYCTVVPAYWGWYQVLPHCW